MLIFRLQSGTNKLASQTGMTGFGMPRSVLGRYNPIQAPDSQGFIHLQMGTNKFASQAGMTGIGMPRHNITKYKDTQRGEIPHDESSLSRQTSGYKVCHFCAMTIGRSEDIRMQTLEHRHWATRHYNAT